MQEKHYCTLHSLRSRLEFAFDAVAVSSIRIIQLLCVDTDENYHRATVWLPNHQQSRGLSPAPQHLHWDKSPQLHLWQVCMILEHHYECSCVWKLACNLGNLGYRSCVCLTKRTSTYHKHEVILWFFYQEPNTIVIQGYYEQILGWGCLV